MKRSFSMVPGGAEFIRISEIDEPSTPVYQVLQKTVLSENHSENYNAVRSSDGTLVSLRHEEHVVVLTRHR